MLRSHIAEIVKWKAKPGVSEAEMIAAVEGIQMDLETLPGFIGQTLYLDDAGFWADLYFWETRAQAVASNDLMAPFASFQSLMGLIEPDSLSIEFLSLPKR